MILLKINSNGNSMIQSQKNGVKTDYFKLQEAASAVPEVISRCKEEYQNHLALK